MSLLLAMQYRADFIIESLISLFFTATALVPLFIIFGDRPSVAGWSFGEALIVTGFFTLLGGVLEGAINPSLAIVVDHIRKGTLDLVLLKPVDAQFLMSTQRFLPWRATALPVAVAIFVYAFGELGTAPSIGQIAVALTLLTSAVLVLYSLWILVVSAAFYVVRVDNLTVLFASIFDAARWPSSVFRGALSVVFTFVIPLALMTTYPAEALLGRIDPLRVVVALAGSLAFAAVARVVWVRSLARYTSAGG
ncbi:MAG: ABC-2 family transporter protein [Myxococcota bacterium]